MSIDHELTELLPFLLHPSPQVVSLALVNCLPYTVQSSPQRRIFLDDNAGPDNKGYLRVFAALARATVDPIIGKAALNCLVNLTDSLGVCKRVATMQGLVPWLLKQITDTSSPLADEACMLMSNLTQLPEVCTACLEIDQTTNLSDNGKGKQKQAVRSLQTLVDLFAKEGLNKHATYDYLAHVFANLSAANIQDGRESLLGMPDSLEEGSTSPVPLSDLVQFTEHSNPTRRAGVSSTLKNCAFVQAAHPLLLTSGSRINFLPYILLPLCGPEEYPADEMEDMPEEIQFLPEDKKRDPDASVRIMLVETLILLCRTLYGRNALRGKGVYHVIKNAHMAERDEQVQAEMERLVNLLMRDEGPDTKLEEIPSSEATDHKPLEAIDDESIVQEV